MKSSIVGFLDDFPLLSILQLTVNSILILTAFFLFRVLKSTQLHINCRYLFWARASEIMQKIRFLLTLWTLGLLLMFLCNFSIGILNLSRDDGYMPENIFEPVLRNRLYRVDVTGIYFTICLEVMIAMERIISSKNPERYYHRKRLALEYLLPCLLLSFAIASVMGNATAVGHYIFIGAVAFVLDATTILVNTFAMKYCRKRDFELFGKCSLNARYQVIESSDMAEAMQPAMIIGIIAKNMVNSIFLASCIRMDESTRLCVPLFFELPFGILETMYSLNMSLNGGFLMAWLLHKHPRLRRNAARLIRALWYSPPTREASSRIVRIDLRVDEGAIYFDSLKKAWE